MKGKPSNYSNKIKTGSPDQGNNMGDRKRATCLT